MPVADPLRVLVYGAGGRMGRAVLDLLEQSSGLRLVAAVSRSDHPLPDRVPAYPATALATVPAFDVAIDFSLAPAFDALLSLCTERGAALVSGTTALSLEQRAAMEVAAARIPILWSSNFSIGVAVLQGLVERAAAQLADWDCEIVEAHHRRKLDAPSGTALSLGEAAARGRGESFAWVSRGGQAGAREIGSIGIASLRGGSVVGEHSVHLLADGERIELSHRAEDRTVFARGALHAATILPGRPAGLYALVDLI